VAVRVDRTDARRLLPFGQDLVSSCGLVRGSVKVNAACDAVNHNADFVFYFHLFKLMYFQCFLLSLIGGFYALVN
jgi:hypothetical protein